MKTPELLLAASLAIAWPSLSVAAGCQYDMQCKGERICQQGQCVFPDAEEQVEPASAKSAASTSTSTSSKAQVPAGVQRCCTVAGKLRLLPGQPGDGTPSPGDTCQGATASGKPIPGTVCN